LIFSDNGKIKGLCAETVNDFAGYISTKYKKKLTIEYKKAPGDFASFLAEVQKSPNTLGYLLSLSLLTGHAISNSPEHFLPARLCLLQFGCTQNE